MNTQRFLLFIVAGFALALTSACGAPFKALAPNEMIVVDDGGRWDSYDFRATTPDGVVFAIRSAKMKDGTDTPVGTLDFWSEALLLRMRTTQGYALLDEEDVVSGDGTGGRMFHFGRDQENASYRYSVAIFTTRKHVHIVEFGGESELYDQHSDLLDEALAGFTIRR